MFLVKKNKNKMFIIWRKCFIFVSKPNIMKNYYHILQVSKEADALEIKQAFRQLSKRYHPDRNGGGREFEEKFKEINEAYQVLKDPVRRWQYKQDLQRRPSSAKPGSDWSTPDFATRQRGAKRRKQEHYRRKQQFGRRTAPSGTDSSGLFWSGVLVLVLLLPFFLAAESRDAEEEKRQPVRYEQLDNYNPETSVMDRLDERLQRDIHYFNEIRQVDPDLRGLDLETGYYVLNGKTIKLSWQMLQLIREKHWKRQ